MDVRASIVIFIFVSFSFFLSFLSRVSFVVRFQAYRIQFLGSASIRETVRYIHIVRSPCAGLTDRKGRRHRFFVPLSSVDVR